VTFLVNDLSFHGQFHDLGSCKDAINRLMAIRKLLSRFGRELHCHRSISQANVMQNMAMLQAIANFTIEEKRSILSWITKNGPFWDESRNHNSEDLLECNGDIVTDTAVGEAAWCQFQEIERELVSVSPSKFEFSPVSVNWHSDADMPRTVQVENHYDYRSLESVLEQVPLLPQSWSQLESVMVKRCVNLTFAKDAFSPLQGFPFARAGAEQLRFILEKLDRFKVCFDESGQRTSDGNELYQNFFTGRKQGGGRGAVFTDSSESEKESFKKEMTFKHPEDSQKTLFCPWHGKVQTPQLRVHFSYPVRANEPLYIVYVGPKITKR
jgi:hypothetical protein